MHSRADEIRRRIAKRKKIRDQVTPKKENKPVFWAEDEERYGFDKISSYEVGPGEAGHPLFNKEIFIFKILASACLFLVVAIMFRSEHPSLQNMKSLVTKTMETDFQFAVVSNWYEEQFGKPLALLPFMEKEKDKNVNVVDETGPQYALPASGRIIQDFAENGQGVIIETGKDASVQALNEGHVVFAGEKEGFGKTVIVQHADYTETWYGNLETIEVTLYKFVEKGTKLGKATDSTDGTKSSFNLAVKKGDDFIDPIQVIRFE